MPRMKCLTTACNGRATWKGLCSICYREAKKLVESGKMTWLRLEMLGLAAPGNTIGGPGKSMFLTELGDKVAREDSNKCPNQ